jgi:hypothetical protein
MSGNNGHENDENDDEAEARIRERTADGRFVSPTDVALVVRLLDETRKERDRLRLLYGRCAQCGCELEETTKSPHCDECVVDEDHRDAWDEAVGV